MSELPPEVENPQNRLEDGLTLLRRIRQATVTTGIKSILSQATTFTDVLAEYAINPMRDIQTKLDTLAHEYYERYKNEIPLHISSVSTAGPINTMQRVLKHLKQIPNPYDFFKSSPQFWNNKGLSEEHLEDPNTTIIAPLSTDFLIARSVGKTLEGRFPIVLPVALSADLQTCIFDNELDVLLDSREQALVVIFTDQNDTGNTAQAIFNETCRRYPGTRVIAAGYRSRL